MAFVTALVFLITCSDRTTLLGIIKDEQGLRKMRSQMKPMEENFKRYFVLTRAVISTEKGAETQLLTLTIPCLEKKLLSFQQFCILSVEVFGMGNFQKGFVNASPCCYLNSSGSVQSALCCQGAALWAGEVFAYMPCRGSSTCKCQHWRTSDPVIPHWKSVLDLLLNYHVR